MPRQNSSRSVIQSVLDRLIDRDPSAPEDVPRHQAESVREFKAAVRRDLEWLLNTRRTPEAAGSPAYVARSAFSYGLPDITSLSHESDLDRDRLRQAVEAAVAMFEPRLVRVKVTELDRGRRAPHVLRFQIQGMLLMDPEPEQVSFDTYLQLSSGEYQVKGEPGAR